MNIEVNGTVVRFQLPNSFPKENKLFEYCIRSRSGLTDCQLIIKVEINNQYCVYEFNTPNYRNMGLLIEALQLELERICECY